MKYRVKITENPQNLLFQWDWSVLEPGNDYVSMKNEWRGVLDDHYAFGSSLSRRGAERAARKWIRKYEKDVAKRGPAPPHEFVEIQT